MLQRLKPHTVALDSTLWSADPEDEKLLALHQTISDMHHLVGEHVVLRDSQDNDRAQQLGIDFLETFGTEQLSPEALLNE